MKVAVIGGGSSYTPELLDGFLQRQDRIAVDEICLMDPDAERLAINAGFATRMATRMASPIRIRETDSLDEAVRDAKYVITQIRVGQMAARIADEKLGLRHGIIGQETTGVGGFANAIRTIPRVLDVARAMERLAPDAYLLNFTNPAGIVSEAVIKHSGVRCVGLCNIPIGITMETAAHFGVAPDAIELDYVGLNHLAWVAGVRIAGKDSTSQALDAYVAHAAEEWDDPEVCVAMQHAIRRLGMYCNPYLQYFYATDACVRRLAETPRTRGEVVLDIERALFEKYADPATESKPEELSKRGGAHYSTAAFMLVEAIEHDTGARQIVCCRNADAVPTFDADVAVEVPAIIGAHGATALPQSAPAPEIRGLMQQIKAYESLAVAAAVTGSRDAAYDALLANPMTHDATGFDRLLEDVLETNRPYLSGTFF